MSNQLHSSTLLESVGQHLDDELGFLQHAEADLASVAPFLIDRDRLSANYQRFESLRLSAEQLAHKRRRLREKTRIEYGETLEISDLVRRSNDPLLQAKLQSVRQTHARTAGLMKAAFRTMIVTEEVLGGFLQKYVTSNDSGNYESNGQRQVISGVIPIEMRS